MYFTYFSVFGAPSLHRKFQLQDLWSCALAWFCQKHHLTAHTHFISTLLTTFLFTPLAIHTRHRHEPRMTIVCRMLFQYTDLRYRFQSVFHNVFSRISIRHFLTPSRKE